MRCGLFLDGWSEVQDLLLFSRRSRGSISGESDDIIGGATRVIKTVQKPEIIQIASNNKETQRNFKKMSIPRNLGQLYTLGHRDYCTTVNKFNDKLRIHIRKYFEPQPAPGEVPPIPAYQIRCGPHRGRMERFTKICARGE